VVNDHRFAETNTLPARSSAPISIAATYLVFGEKSWVELNIAVLPSELRDTIPVMGVVSSAFFTVNVFVLIVGLLIGSLNVALTSEVTGTSVAPSAGRVLSTYGGSFSPLACFVAAAAAEAAAAAFSVADSAPLIPK
jgi:hypothetical protein